MLPSTLDVHAPAEVAAHVVELGALKVKRDAATLLALSGLAGAFISLGALLFAVVTTGSTLGFGPTRLVGGIAFSLGLILVIVAGAELFTGNNLLAMAWASGRIRTAELMRTWAIVLVGNIGGALLTVLLAWFSGVHRFGGGAVGATLNGILVHKTSLGAAEMFALGVLCNALVCLAVWLAMAGRSAVDKIVAIVPPIAAFVAMGFEHSIANLFLLPYGLLLAGDSASALVGPVLMNLVLVTLGNVFGGAGLVAGVYWTVYVRPNRRSEV